MLKAFARFLSEAIYAALVCLIAFITLLVLILAGMNRLVFSPGDLIKTTLLFLLPLVGYALVIGLAVGIIAAAVSAVPSLRASSPRVPWFIFLLLYIGQIIVGMFINFFIFKKLALDNNHLILVLLFAVILGGIIMLLAPALGSSKRISLVLSAVMILVLLVIIPLGVLQRKPANKEAAIPKNLLRPPGYKVVIIGIDALDWHFADPLLAEGKLPNLDYLIKNGSRSALATIEPTSSPLIWTTIATGKTWEYHQITDFVIRRIPLTGVEMGSLVTPRYMWVKKCRLFLFNHLFHIHIRDDLVTGLQRKEKALWNIFSEQGLKSGVINWLMSWPAENVDGLLVSDKVIYYRNAANFKEAPLTTQLTSPPGLIDELAPLLFPPEQVSDDTFHRYMDIGNDDIARMRSAKFKVHAIESEFVFTISTDESLKRISLRLMKERPDISFWAVYYNGVDSFSHSAMAYSSRFKDPSVNQDRVKKYGRVMDEAYKDADRFIGDIVKSFGPDAVFIVVSDHGFKKEWNGEYGHKYGPPGAVVISRGPVLKGAAFKNPSVYDVAPTVLYLSGLPTAEDMPGRVWTEVLDPEFVRLHPVRTIKTYGAYTPVKKAQADAGVDKEIERHLKALGYIK